jgi:hypothetical protein
MHHKRPSGIPYAIAPGGCVGQSGERTWKDVQRLAHAADPQQFAIGGEVKDRERAGRIVGAGRNDWQRGNDSRSMNTNQVFRNNSWRRRL